MKFINVLIIVLLATGLSFSQSSFVFVSHDTIVSGAPGATLCARALIKSTSSGTINAFCKREIISMVSGNANQFCWGGACWSFGTDTSHGTETIGSNSIDTAFYGYMYDNSNSSLNDTVRYTVWNANNASDSLSWVVIYEYGPAGINKIASGPKNTLVNAFPDPTDNAATIQYSLAKDARTAKINVMNMLGNKVAEFQLDLRESKFVIPNNSLAPGIYFYSLEVDGSTISTKKLVVNR